MRTRAPVAGGKASFSPLPLDLHVLGLPLAFILSQDQTLHNCFSKKAEGSLELTLTMHYQTFNVHPS